MKTRFVLTAIIFFDFLYSCKEFSKNPIHIIQAPFSDLDTTRISGSLQRYKSDIFIVDGEASNKNLLRVTIDSFIQTIKKNAKHYKQYDVSFYKKNKEINIKSIEECAYGSRWKIFVHNKKSFIISYQWLNGDLLNVDDIPK